VEERGKGEVGCGGDEEGVSSILRLTECQCECPLYFRMVVCLTSRSMKHKAETFVSFPNNATLMLIIHQNLMFKRATVCALQIA